MKKVIFGIFAHPDDEAFGPAGTLLKLKDEGYDIHLILLTDGEAGVNIDNVPDLAATRLAEWQVATQLLGASSTHPLHYPDGGLENVLPEDLEHNLNTIIATIIGRYPETPELAFMTFEPHGLTGHHDHIAAATLTTRVAKKYSAEEVWYFCLDSSQAPLSDTALYEPHAREDDYITNRIDVSAFLDTIYHVIDTHVSQRKDGANRKALGKERLSKECFHIER